VRHSFRLLEARRAGRNHVGPSGLIGLFGVSYPDLTVGAIKSRRFAPHRETWSGLLNLGASRLYIPALRASPRDITVGAATFFVCGGPKGWH
jgi:hypothetical protein